MTPNRTINNAISASVQHQSIVYVADNDINHTDLLTECDDYVDSNSGVREYWGTDHEGNSWRIHTR